MIGRDALTVGGTKAPARAQDERDDGSGRRPSSAERIGRHYVLGLLGRGGMGIVYDAYDPELDRRIAIKVLGRRSPAGHDKLLAEAQAMARVSHPNVIQVYDVGTFRGQVFVAMERLEGGTLAEWLSTARPDPAAIIERFAQAGRGLAAAHATGLVHQDFKPDNVMLGDDGRPRVLDFGIARLLDTPTKDATPASRPRGARRAQPEGVGGTPAYMAPEQFAGAKVDARADQFAFCVALYEALVGRRPFAGDTVVELAVAVLEQEPPPLPASAGAPRYVARALLRGLAREPAARFPAMEPLLAELERDPTQTRRRVALGLAFAAAILGTGALVSWRSASASQCTGASTLDELWNSARAEQVARALRVIGLRYADDNARRVLAKLDAYALRWKEIHRDNCEATTIRREQSEAAMDLRLACLHRASQALEATVAILVDADEEVSARALPMVDALPELSRCDNLDALTTEVPEPSPEHAPRVDEARAVLASAAAAKLAGRYEQAFALASALDRNDVASVYGPLESEIAIAMANIEHERRNHEEAERWIDRALASAMRWSQWSIAGEAAVRGMFTVGASLSRPREAMKYAPVADGISERANTPLARAFTAMGHAAILRAEGRYDDAEQLYRRVLELYRARGDDTITTATTHINFAANLKLQGRYDDAATHYERAIEIYTKSFGALHPKVISTRWGLAGIHAHRGDYEQAEREYRWVLERREERFGGRGPDLMRAQLGLARVLTALERHDEAEASARAAIGAYDSSAGAKGLLATAYNNLGNALELQGDLSGAEDAQREALELQRARKGDDHPSVAVTRSAIGLILEKRGDPLAAEREQRAALEVLEDKLGADHPTTANVRSNLGTALAGQGRVKEALELQRAALSASRAKLGDEHPQTVEIAALVRALESR